MRPTMQLALAFALGVLGWSLLEYLIHRWFGHDKRLIRNPFGAEHTAHHSRGNYFAPAYKKAIVIPLVFSLFAIPGGAIFGAAPAIAFAAGLVGYYLLYEALHYLAHVRPAVTAYGRWLRLHHFHHHFHEPRRNFGVSSPLWDFVFRTNVPLGRVVVPKKLAMRWLVDPATGDVRAEHAADYALALRPNAEP